MLVWNANGCSYHHREGGKHSPYSPVPLDIKKNRFLWRLQGARVSPQPILHLHACMPVPMKMCYKRFVPGLHWSRQNIMLLFKWLCSAGSECQRIAAFHDTNSRKLKLKLEGLVLSKTSCVGHAIQNENSFCQKHFRFSLFI